MAPKSYVRTDHKTQTLDGMFQPIATPTSMNDSERLSKRRKGEEEHGEEPPRRQSTLQHQAAPRVSIPQSETALTSVKELRKEVIERKNAELDALIKNHVFVGVVGPDQPLSAVQHQQKLLLINHVAIA